MARSWAVVLLALLFPGAGVAPAGGKADVEIAGKLSRDDPRDSKRDAPCKVHVVKLKGNRVYTIDMVSAQFDTYLRLEDKGGTELAEDDDGGGGLNARIVFNCPADGDYKVICTSFSPQGAGDYALTIRLKGQEQKTASGHEALIGKAAPDFEGDFAVNGKAVKLSDLKGKVVLVGFWEVRSGPSVAALRGLHDCHKTHKAEGLEVVGVTFYHSDLGHNLGFDREAGKVRYVAKGSKETEQVMLQEFAAHHKVEHLLLALPSAAALETFNAYRVNGLPQLVLIDRKGVVRTIRVGEKSAVAMEDEVRKLLAEK